MPNENINYYTELTHNLKHKGFAVGPEENNLLPIEFDGQPLCRATENGGVRWQDSDIIDDRRSALDSVIDIAKTTHEYMSQMEAAPKLTADGLEGDFRLLSEFNGTVLAGHPTEYGVQFVTWERTYNQTGLWQGHYIGPGCGTADYAAAKQDFAVRSGLIPASALFTPEQLTEVYRSIGETLEKRSTSMSATMRRPTVSGSPQMSRTARIRPRHSQSLPRSRQRSLPLHRLQQHMAPTL